MASLFKTKVAVGLVHYPVLDRAGDKVCTNITNFDVHDIARACRTYGVERYYLINSMREQLMFASRMIDHWKTGYGKRFNPMRSTALTNIHFSESYEDCIKEWCVGNSLLVATSAKSTEGLSPLGFTELRQKIENNTLDSVFILFGTGFGLHSEVLDKCDALLAPIKGASADDYRHLSVRSAVSICLDRLMGL